MNTSQLNLTINTINSDHAMPLYEEDRGQEGPAYLYLDTRDGDVYLRGIHPAHASSWGVDEHNGHVRKWSIPNNLTVRGYNALLADTNVLQLLERVYQGAEEYYDGNNYKTRLNDDAEAADIELEKITAEINQCGADYESLDAWDASMWLELSTYANLVKEGESHEDAALRLHGEALREGKYCSIANLENVLDRMKQELEEEEH